MQTGVTCPSGPPPYLISSYVVLPGSIIIISLVRRELGNRWPRNSRGKLLSRGRVGIAAGLSEKDFVQQQVNGIYTRGWRTRADTAMGVNWEIPRLQRAKRPMPTHSLSVGRELPSAIGNLCRYLPDIRWGWMAGRTETAFKRKCARYCRIRMIEARD